MGICVVHVYTTDACVHSSIKVLWCKREYGVAKNSCTALSCTLSTSDGCLYSSCVCISTGLPCLAQLQVAQAHQDLPGVEWLRILRALPLPYTARPCDELQRGVTSSTQRGAAHHPSVSSPCTRDLMGVNWMCASLLGPWLTQLPPAGHPATGNTCTCSPFPSYNSSLTCQYWSLPLKKT